jgi:hypothetical protein
MVAVGLFAYLELTMDAPRSSVVLLVGNIVCPPAIISVFFFDFDSRSVEAVTGWLLIAILNSGLYAVLGGIFLRLFQRFKKSNAL